MLKFAALSLLLFILLLAAPTSLAQETAQPVPEDGEVTDLLTTLESLGDFTVLVKALRDTGLDTALTTTETFTVFAPTDDAFQALPTGTLDRLTAEQLTGILRRHVIVGAVSSEDASSLGTATTVEGSTLDIVATGDGLMVGNAFVVDADVQATNGIIHVINAVLLPDAKPAPMKDGMKDQMDEDGIENLFPSP